MKSWIKFIVLTFTLLVSYITNDLKAQDSLSYFVDRDTEGSEVILKQNYQATDDSTSLWVKNIARSIKESKAIIKAKGYTLGANFFYILADNQSWGVEASAPVFSKMRNIAFVAGYNQLSTTYIDDDSRHWDYPKIQRFKSGFRYFPGYKPYRGLFFGDFLDFSTARYYKRRSSIEGKFKNVGFITEVGLRIVFLKYIYLQSSFGVGWTFSISDSVKNNDENLTLPKNDGLNVDGTLVVGFYL